MCNITSGDFALSGKMRPEINCPRRAYGPNRRAPNPHPCCCRRPARVRGCGLLSARRAGSADRPCRCPAKWRGRALRDDGFARGELYFDDLHIVTEYFVIYFFTAHAGLFFSVVFLEGWDLCFGSFFEIVFDMFYEFLGCFIFGAQRKIIYKICN